MRVPDAIRRLVLRLSPWYDPAAERRRERRALAAHLRAIQTRKQAERTVTLVDALAARYRRQDDAFRHR